MLQHVTLELRRDDWPGWDTVAARLQDEGYEVNERPRQWGAARCFVRAPGSHRVELMAAPPS